MIVSERPVLNRKGDFRYESLPHPITHIRLLEVIPVTDDQDVTIQCRLKCVRLVEFDQCYSALSYTWSHTDDSHPIWVNGHYLNVNSNLYDFLYLYRQKLRRNDVQTVFLWIDALCLNFADVRERNSQVQIVPTIFQRAKMVLAWLEPLPIPQTVGGSRAGVRKFTEFLGQIRKDLELTPGLSSDQYLGNRYLAGFRNQSKVDFPFSDEWEIMLQLCEHKYWTRRWILLENKFAQNLTFMYGDQLWSWSEFKTPFVLMHYMTKTGQYAIDISRKIEPAMILHSHAAEVVKMRLNFEEPQQIISTRGDAIKYDDFATERWSFASEREDLSDLLKKHARKMCFQRVDKIYALLGLSNSILTVDYDRSNIELFCAVLLSLKVSLELSFVSLLAHNLGVKAFEYHQGRQSMIKDVTSFASDPSVQDMVGADCHRVYCVKAIPNRSEVTDIIQARLGLQKLNYYRILSQQNLDKMQEWTDFPKTSNEMPRFYGHTPGTVMPIVDGFDLSDTSFRAAIFLNPSNRSGKTVFGMISTDFVQDGDILVTEPSMYSGMLVRISGLSKTWLTVVGVILFARRVSVESELSLPFLPQSTTSTIRSATLSDFCELTFPTPFTIAACDDKEHFTLRPKDVQIKSLFSGTNAFNGRESRATTYSNTTSSSWNRPSTRSTMRTITTIRPVTRGNDKRLASKSDRLERFMEAINLRKRSRSK